MMHDCDSMSCNEYMQQRVDQQIDWYDRKSMHKQKLFKHLRAVEIILAALIPVMTTIGAIWEQSLTEISLLGSALLGAMVAMLAGFIGLDRYQELWISYRTTCESLKKEKLYFLTASTPYDQPDSFALFVARVESLLSNENTNWSKLIQQHNPATPSADGKSD